MDPEACSSCGAALEADGQGGLRCPDCGAVAAGPFTQCPKCRHRNDPGAAACAQCAAELTAVCRGCGRVNWSGSERCAGCGRELDPLGHAFRTVGQSFELRREELRNRASALRLQEEEKSRARLDLLREADRRRMQRAAEAAETARRRERRIVITVSAAAAVFLILVVAAIILSH